MTPLVNAPSDSTMALDLGVPYVTVAGRLLLGPLTSRLRARPWLLESLVRALPMLILQHRLHMAPGYELLHVETAAYLLLVDAWCRVP